ncbi:MAG: nicotinic acid mononucleotide adenylyltransferase [Chloroflexi bacterium]|nr:nicotinic acid mononucleotide adenylyltransferase [Chloroflexota bacterium]|tara:strand:+ start:700 stop:1299 length:600 start_codon:yes stop_codon:yes gene_type:complete
MRRGILGGTFDPIHTGHLILAQEVLWQLGLDQLWFVPTGLPWMKRDESITDGVHRKAMVELAIKDNNAFFLSTSELERPGETYTVDTLEEMRSGDMADDELLFVMGADTLHTLHLWKKPKRILELARIIVALRPGYGPINLDALLAVDPTASERIMTVQMPLIEISGKELRRRATRGESIKYLVPDQVAHYIDEHSLYR